MPPFFRPAMMPSPPSATARTAAASVTIENTTSEAAATARGVGASRMPAAINDSAFCLLRFQPVTAWPAAMSRGTMPAPMAPRPTKPMFMPSPRWISRSAMMPPNRRKGYPRDDFWLASSPAKAGDPVTTECTMILDAPPSRGMTAEDSLDHDLDLVAGIGVVVGSKPVEDAKALERAVGHRHAARQALDGVTACDGHDLDVQRLCRLAFRQRHATEGADRFAKGAIDLRGRALGGEDEAIDVAPEPHRIEPKHPLVALGGCGRRRQPVDDGLLDGFGVDVLDPAGGQVIRERLFRGHAHDIEPQGLAAAFLDAENRLRGVVEHESLRRQEGETEPGVQETAAAHEALARVLAVDHAVDAGEIGGLIAFAGAGRVELAGARLRVPDALGGRGMGGEEIGRARGDVRLAGVGFQLGIVPHRGEEARGTV